MRIFGVSPEIGFASCTGLSTGIDCANDESGQPICGRELHTLKQWKGWVIELGFPQLIQVE